MRKALRRISAIFLIFSALIFASVIYFNNKLPQSFSVYEGEKLVLSELNGITAQSVQASGGESPVLGKSEKSSVVKLMGIIPIKTVHLTTADRASVTPGGTAFGIKLFTKGVIVIDTNSVDSKEGNISPAKLCGIEKGDIILNIDGKNIRSNEQVTEIISSSNGRRLEITYLRGGIEKKTVMSPVMAKSDNRYKGGMWVRDSSAGIGTITYYDRRTGNFAGLGHGICDVDTGEIMPLSEGEVCDVQINSVKKGKSGAPGELKGSFVSQKSVGKLYINNESGIFGTLDKAPNSLKPIPVMLKQEVKAGPAKIICTLDQGGPREYDIQIDRVDLNPKTQTKNMMISVTDEELLAKTGGIVQGMSGSPIIQNGKLVGAVTHVFVNDPKRGYGIFAENMLEYSHNIGDYRKAG